MLIRRQDDFDNFKCIAGDCEKSCCAGWQICVDEESMERYGELCKGSVSRDAGVSRQQEDELAEILNIAIDWEEESFRADEDGRCCMLRPDGLCALQADYGEDALCWTCRLFPRHEEDFYDVREWTLSLACPSAVDMLFEKAVYFSWSESEIPGSDDEADYEDYDYMLYDRLDYARGRIAELSVMRHVAEIAKALQDCYDEGDVAGMDEALIEHTASIIDYEQLLRWLSVFSDIEATDPGWQDDFSSYYGRLASDSSLWEDAKNLTPHEEHILTNVFLVFFHTHFCGAVYDGEIYARACLAAVGVCFIMLDMHTRPLRQAIYLYSREVEHSEENMNTMIKWFERDLDA